MLTKILEYQGKTILNTDEIKWAYLQSLRVEKSANTISAQMYYSKPDTQEAKTTPTSENKTSTQKTWMFKRVD